MALVGNGPVSARQRQRIASMDVILRFNAPNGFSPGVDGRTTVWAVRHAAAATRRGYWGPEQLDDAESVRLIESAEVRCRRASPCKQSSQVVAAIFRIVIIHTLPCTF